MEGGRREEGTQGGREIKSARKDDKFRCEDAPKRTKRERRIYRDRGGREEEGKEKGA
jgi:hypothetical protein